MRDEKMQFVLVVAAGIGGTTFLEPHVIEKQDNALTLRASSTNRPDVDNCYAHLLLKLDRILVTGIAG